MTARMGRSRPSAPGRQVSMSRAAPTGRPRTSAACTAAALLMMWTGATVLVVMAGGVLRSGGRGGGPRPARGAGGGPPARPGGRAGAGRSVDEGQGVADGLEAGLRRRAVGHGVRRDAG